MPVEIVLDVICVWSYLGYTRFSRAAAAARAAGQPVDVTFLPFELAPGAPTVGAPLVAVLERMFGPGIYDENKRVAALAAQDGLELRYDRAVATGTFEAHGLIAVAARQGRAEPMVERLFRAHFTDGLHIGDRETLMRLAGEVGVSWRDDGAEEVRAELARVRPLAPHGIPVFRFPSGSVLSGARSEDEFRAALGGTT